MTARAADDPARRAEILRQALGLWRGPALADVADAAFAVALIARLEELRIAAIEDRMDAEIALGHAAWLVPELEELTTRHPLRERVRGQLMRALDAAGRRADALTLYEDTRRTLADRLGDDPSPELSAVHLAILRRAPDTTERPEHAEPVPRGMTNLPAQFTSFVGREREIAQVGELLATSRLVTLTGPGGAGKTRLASEAASRLAAGMPDGVWFVPLAPVRAPAGHWAVEVRQIAGESPLRGTRSASSRRCSSPRWREIGGPPTKRWATP